MFLIVVFLLSVALLEATAIEKTDNYQKVAANFINKQLPGENDVIFPTTMPYPQRLKALGFGILYTSRNVGGADRLIRQAPKGLGVDLREEIMERLIMSLHAILVPEPMVADLLNRVGQDGMVKSSDSIPHTARALGILAMLDKDMDLRSKMAEALIVRYKPETGAIGLRNAFIVLRAYSQHYVDDKKKIGQALIDLYNWIVNNTPPIDNPAKLCSSVSPGGLSAGADILHALSAYYVATGDESAIKRGEALLEYLINTYWIKPLSGNGGFSYRPRANRPDLAASGEMIQALYWFDQARFYKRGMPGK
jgi:hypothetical protein